MGGMESGHTARGIATDHLGLGADVRSRGERTWGRFGVLFRLGLVLVGGHAALSKGFQVGAYSGPFR